MNVISGDVYDIVRLKNQNSNMAEKCFNAYKTVCSLFYAYDADVSEATYYDAEEILLEARQGNLWAIYEIGFMFENGICFQKDLKTAFFWYEKGAKRGDDACQLALFYMYRLENSSEHNLYKSIFWLKQSAENGNASAMLILGQVYAEGFVEEIDIDKALFWLEKSAKAGYSEAMLYLGHMSEEGMGDSIDLDNAYKWYLMASKYGNTQAHMRLAQLVFDEFSDNDKYLKKAVFYLNKSIRMGNNNALFALGTHYKSLGGAYNKKAFSLLKRSADICDNILAAFEVAEMYETGCGVKADADKAAEYYSKVLNLL